MKKAICFLICLLTGVLSLVACQEAATPVSLEITAPYKGRYAAEDALLDLEGGKVAVKYSDKSIKDEVALSDKAVTISEYSLAVEGTVAITVNYKGLKGTFDVVVEEIKATPVSLEITVPYKVRYVAGDSRLDLDGGKVAVRYSDDSVKDEVALDNDAVTISKYSLESEGTVVITVNYKGLKGAFDVVIESIKATPVSLEITAPYKVRYVAGEARLDLEGGKVAVKYSDESIRDEVALYNEAVEVSEYSLTNEGTVVITVNYKGLSGTFDVTVRPKDAILILERDHDSFLLSPILTEEFGYKNTTVKNISQAPGTVKELLEYDEVILMNIANSDMPKGFDGILNSYVRDFGGGLLTVGGNREEGGKLVQNAYNRSDMINTLYQQMLPVQAIDFTQPLALMIVIDRSASMSTETQIKTLMELAKDGAIACVNNLSERDYCGIVSFDDIHKVEIGLTPATQKNKIIGAIGALEPRGATVYTQAIEAACRELVAAPNVEKKHILFVTDGEPRDDPEDFNAMLEYYYKTAGITTSVLTINATAKGAKIGYDMTLAAGGKDVGSLYYDAAGRDMVNIPNIMREDLTVPAIREYEQEEFKPAIASNSPITSGINEVDIPMLGGFYGTKVKRDATVVLSAKYVPVYAYWQYGKGKVGSFMCDLDGTWSNEFLADETGKKIIQNIIGELFFKYS